MWRREWDDEMRLREKKRKIIDKERRLREYEREKERREKERATMLLCSQDVTPPKLSRFPFEDVGTPRFEAMYRHHSLATPEVIRQVEEEELRVRMKNMDTEQYQSQYMR
jgi:hypothetical protein